MLNRIVCGLSALTLAFYVSSAAAYCPEGHGHGQGHGAKSARVASDVVDKASKEEAAKKGGCAKEASGGCCKKKAQLASASAGEGGCSHAKKALTREEKVEAVLASLPAVKYRVGDSDTCCSKAASAMLASAGANAKMKYVVGEEVFETEAAAQAKLASLLEKQLADMQTMQFAAGGECGRCPMHAREVAKKTNSQIAYRVGGIDFTEKEKAEKALKLVNEVASSVKMSCKVDGKLVDCPSSCSASDKAQIVYVVGEEETPCRETAVLKTLQAKIRKAVEAAAALEA